MTLAKQARVPAYVIFSDKTLIDMAGRAPLIGFAGSPWTVATYMIEGGSSRDFPKSKALLYSDPQALHGLLGKLARATVDYLNAQIVSGAQAVMIFDTWGGILSTRAYYEFSLAYMEQVVADLIREREGRRVPVILFTKGGGAWLERLSATGADALGVDWMTELSAARRDTQGRVALQGNLDPGVLFATPAAIRFGPSLQPISPCKPATAHCPKRRRR